jgi:uncharacterized membrane protein (DUF4010 family)
VEKEVKQAENVTSANQIFLIVSLFITTEASAQQELLQVGPEDSLHLDRSSPAVYARAMDSALDLATFRDFAIALLIGALVGTEREQHKRSDPGSGVAGLRTFILLAMLGAVSAWLGSQLQTPWLFVAILVAASAALVVGYFMTVQAYPGSLGLTTEVAGICVCLLGGMTMIGYPELAVVLGIVVTAVLAYKEPMHGMVSKLDRDDIFAGVRLLIASFIVLPLLPRRPLDPWGALNPYSLWLLVILISSLSLIGYVATRWLGPGKGAALTGLSGGLVSSTAVTLTFARTSRDGRGAPTMLATGILLAWGVMFVRVVVEVAVVYPPLVYQVVGPFLMMGAAGLAAALYFYRQGPAAAGHQQAGQEVPLKNPFSLTGAAKFAVFFAGVLLVVKLVEDRFSSEGLYLVAAVAGLTDVDAITLSMARYAQTGGQPGIAVTAITIAALTNTVVKCAMVAVLGGRALRVRLVPSTLVIIVMGLLALVVI